MMNEYERQRMERIQRNQEQMRRLGLVEAASDLAATAPAAPPGSSRRASASARKRARAAAAGGSDDDDDDDYRPSSASSPRRSRRLQGGDAERPRGLEGVDELMALGGAAGAQRRQRLREQQRRHAADGRPLYNPPAGAAADDEAAYDGHNAYRLSYMSDAQLWRRVEQVTNAAKLRSFAEALWRSGRADMARRAYERLGEAAPAGEPPGEGGEEEEGDGEQDQNGGGGGGGGGGKENREEDRAAAAAADEAALARRRVAELPASRLATLAGKVREIGELKALIEALEEEAARSDLDGARERAWARLEALQRAGGGGAAAAGGAGSSGKKRRR
jgi:hypothetical protein